MQSSGNPGRFFRSEMPDNSTAGENIVLAALARIQTELRHARPEVSAFAAYAEAPEDPHIEPHPGLEYARVGSRLASVRTSEEQRRAL